MRLASVPITERVQLLVVTTRWPGRDGRWTDVHHLEVRYLPAGGGPATVRELEALEAASFEEAVARGRALIAAMLEAGELASAAPPSPAAAPAVTTAAPAGPAGEGR